ncbi:hypothetical protein [Duganella sp. Root198D2]|uniref:hypothetical protein n=1 Tax=Duganella sp. Root198D2 TaxID=1736489 RepID=UPI0007149D00|nr:hypothetical protein [Duganella sp. Root198D2]KRB98269.1 hypothetical protein ASE26_25505 [Duganella sp. Root198D2]
MNLVEISNELVTLFPDDRVTRDLNEQLFADLPAGESLLAELDGALFKIPPMCQHEVCTVVLQSDLIPASAHVRVFCAVGGVKGESSGIIESNICFALLKYNKDGSLYTYDLYSSQFD